MRMFLRSQPSDQFHQILFGHRGATRAGSLRSPTDMKKNCAAGSGHRRVGIVPNLNEPAIREVVVPHPLLFEPRRRVRRIVNDDVPVVIW